jgi:dTDP-4-dehydrorhamnose 3,5-epimerase
LPTLTIPTFTGDLAAAHDDARRAVEPRFVPAGTYVDDRGWSLMNLMQGVLGPEGQINYSVVYPNVIKAWHRHQRQTDFWMCVQGHIRVGVCRDEDKQVWQLITGEKRAGIVIIPPPLWHGVAAVGPTQAAMFYYVTHAYDPKNPDEQRRGFDSIDGFQWGVEHR